MSLRLLDIGQSGAGLRGTLALVEAGGARTNGITAGVPTRDPVSARPFEPMALVDDSREEFLPLEQIALFEPKESLQLLDGGKQVLAADQYSIWLLQPGSPN